MPDINANLTVDINSSSGNTAAIATDYYNSAHFQVNKMAFGGETAAIVRVSSSTPLPVNIQSTTTYLGITGSVGGLGNFKVINGATSTLIVSGTTSTSYVPVQINGTVQGVVGGVNVPIEGTVSVGNSITILGGSTLSLVNPVGITGGRRLSYTTDSVSIFGSTLGISVMPNLLMSKDSIRVYGACGGTEIPVNLRDGSGNLIGSSGGALNVNLIGAGITATVTVSALVGVCQAYPNVPFTVTGVTAGTPVRIIGTQGTGELNLRFVTNPSIDTIVNPVTVDLGTVPTGVSLIQDKLSTTYTLLSNQLNGISASLNSIIKFTNNSSGVAEAGIKVNNYFPPYVPSAVYTGIIGITAGVISSISGITASLYTGITIKNKGLSDVNMKGTIGNQGNYSISSGEILFIETNSFSNISFSVNSGTGSITYIAT